ncbi:hypothetical protein [Halorarum halobium]|uniref:hypothetical protein n=1 Tax=Halorarum halobium TaxID=3075121 RepID=UPI0028B1FED1|nr:hypothetical protein [Halobaculum sp. XH14]
MADDEDRGLLNISLTQKIQLGAIGVGTLLFLLTYLVQGLLNGFSYVNQWILGNLIPVSAYWTLLIGLVPIYRQVDLRELKYLKQSIYTAISMGIPFLLFWLYYQFYPPTTGLGRVVEGLSYVITVGSALNLLISKGFHGLNKGE